MTHEKTLTLQTGRCVKLITQLENPMKIEIDVLIKDPSETHYHPPIGLTHPKYWKLKRMGTEKSRELQIKYSGLTDKQLRNVLREFKQMQN